MMFESKRIIRKDKSDMEEFAHPGFVMILTSKNGNALVMNTSIQYL